MQTKIIPIITGFVFLLLVLTSCDDSSYKEYTGNIPVYMSYQELRSSVTRGNTQDLVNPGKIYFKDNYIFIVEEQKGIHIYDNSNPSQPLKKDFITVPGIVDISISGNTLYADSYIDLVVLDVEDVTNVHEVGRLTGVLPYTLPATNNSYPTASIDESRGVVREWKVGTVREKVNSVISPYPYPFYDLSSSSFLQNSNAQGASSGVSGSGIGVGGSMARFGIRDNTLYVLTSTMLKILDISAKTKPVQVDSIYPGWNVETMFLSDTNMFLGTTTGMVIYNISYPATPAYKAFYKHVNACDPVIVSDTLAYVTLRSGNTCGGSSNELDIVNIKNLSNPVLLKSYPLVNPGGLAKSGNLLFICDGESGLKIFDATDPMKISDHMLATYSQMNNYDVIAVNGILFVTGSDGLSEYDYSSPQNIILVSKISVVKSSD